MIMEKPTVESLFIGLNNDATSVVSKLRIVNAKIHDKECDAGGIKKTLEGVYNMLGDMRMETRRLILKIQGL